MNVCLYLSSIPFHLSLKVPAPNRKWIILHYCLSILPLGSFLLLFLRFLQMLYGRCERILPPSFVTQWAGGVGGGGASNSHWCHSVHKEQHGHGSSAESWWLWIQLPLVITHRRIWPFWKSTVCLSQPQSGRLTYFPWLFSLACKCQGRPQSPSRKGPCMSVRPSFPQDTGLSGSLILHAKTVTPLVFCHYRLSLICLCYWLKASAAQKKSWVWAFATRFSYFKGNGWGAH